MSSDTRGGRQHTHFADEHTLERLQQLERENAELRRELALAHAVNQGLRDDLGSLRVLYDRDELRRDREMLRDALKIAKRELLDVNSNAGTRAEVSEYIDAAMQEDA